MMGFNNGGLLLVLVIGALLGPYTWGEEGSSQPQEGSTGEKPIPAFITPQPEVSAKSRPPLKGHLVTLPANITFIASLDSPFDSSLSEKGDTVYLTIDRPLTSKNGVTLVPSGAKLLADVVDIDKAGRFDDSAEVEWLFHTLVLPTGDQLPLSGRLATDSGKLSADSLKGRAAKLGVKTVVGALAGATLGAVGSVVLCGA